MVNKSLVFAAILLMAGCADTQSSAPAPAAQPAAAPPAAAAAAPQAGASRKVKSIDGNFDGEIVGVPARGSKFSRIQIGMGQREVEDLIGPPNDQNFHITGKAFIPFFFGGDTHRFEAFYKGEGQLTYSPSHMGTSRTVLIRIIVNPDERGYAH